MTIAQKITDLVELTDVDDADLLVIVDDPAGGAATKKITVGDLNATAAAGGAVLLTTTQTITGAKTFTGGLTVTTNPIVAGTVDADFDAITGTSYGGILEANLLDKTAAEIITNSWIYKSALKIDQDASNSILIFDTDSTSFDCDIQYQAGGVLKALIRYDSGLQILEWRDRDPVNVIRMTLDLNTGDLAATGNLSGATIGGITEANLLDKSATETVTGVWNYTANITFNQVVDFSAGGLNTRWRSIDGTKIVQFAMQNTNECFFEGSSALFIMDGVSFKFRDNNALSFGEGLDVTIQWDGVDLEITGLAANQTINLRDGQHWRMWDSTDTDWLDMHNDGANFSITQSGLTAVVLSGIRLVTDDSTTARAGFNIPEGVAPSSPVDGDVWITAAGGYFARLNGVSVDLSITTTEINDLTAAVTWANVPDTNITEGSVTQHEAAINHDNLLGFVGDEHLDWTADQGASNIDVNNITGALSVTSVTVTSGVNMADSKIDRPLIEDYAIQKHTEGSSSGVLDLNMELGNSITHLFTENITSVTVTNPPTSGKHGEIWLRLTQNASASKTITWPSKFHFPGGVDHVMSASFNAVDVIHMVTIDAGTIYICTFVQDVK